MKIPKDGKEKSKKEEGKEENEIGQDLWYRPVAEDEGHSLLFTCLDSTVC